MDKDRQEAKRSADEVILWHALEIIRQKLIGPPLTRTEQDSLLRFIDMLMQGRR